VVVGNVAVKSSRILELAFAREVLQDVGMHELLQPQFPEISPGDWEFVESLLHDLQAEEDREQIASLFGQWRLSIKAFRRVEYRRMVQKRPETIDMLFHKACVTNLIGFGTMLQVAAAEHTDEELAKHGLKKEVIESLVRDLQNTFDEWHGQVPKRRIDQLRKQIFDAPPELNLSDTRTKV
jgi:hypothetical protein